MTKHITRWSCILLGIYFLFLAFLTLFQEKLIFVPSPTTDAEWTQMIESFEGDYVSIRADDDEMLEGMFLSDKTETPRPTLLVFYGNAMLVEQVAPFFRSFPAQGINVLLMEYRGYGLSTDKPNLNAFKRDAQKIFDAAASHPAVDSDHISALGISLGTGIAAHLASVKPIDRVILISPMTSIADLAVFKYPIFPRFLVRLLLEHEVDTLALAEHLSAPALIVHGTEDREVPVSHGKKIAEAWGDEAELMLIDGKGHNDVLGDREVWESIRKFLVSGF